MAPWPQNLHPAREKKRKGRKDGNFGGHDRGPKREGNAGPTVGVARLGAGWSRVAGYDGSSLYAATIASRTSRAIRGASSSVSSSVGNGSSTFT